jgi:hypothetical protein
MHLRKFHTKNIWDNSRNYNLDLMKEKAIHNPSLEQIAEEVAVAIMEMSYLTNNSIKEKLLPLLRIWLKSNTLAKKSKAPIHKVQLTQEKERFERMYWLEKCRAVYSKEDMGLFYVELEELTKEFRDKLKK